MFIRHSSFVIWALSPLRPDGIIEVFEDLVELIVEDLVEAVEAAAFAFEDEVLIVERGTVHDAVGLGLGGEFFEPFPLGCGPAAGGKHGSGDRR